MFNFKAFFRDPRFYINPNTGEQAPTDAIAVHDGLRYERRYTRHAARVGRRALHRS
jgi:hypothetical protein